MSNNRFDSIIIGGGLAGLSCAAHLARSGQKVKVFEQHKIPGGFYTSFVRRGFIFDISAHWTIDHKRINSMLSGLGVDPLEFEPLKNIGRYLETDSPPGILLTNDKDKFIDSIVQSYPAVNKKSIDKLISLSLQIEKEICSIKPPHPESTPLFSRLFSTAKMIFSLKTVLINSFRKSEDLFNQLFPGDQLKGLRAALSMIAPFKNMPAVGPLVFIGFALRGRAFHPRGGALKVGLAFADAVEKNGGSISYCTMVKKILIKDNRAIGVLLNDGSEYYADNIVSAVDARQTFGTLIDSSLVPVNFKNHLKTTPISDPYFIISLVTDIDPSIYGFDNTDTFICSSTDIDEVLSQNKPDKTFYSVQFPHYTTGNRKDGTFGIQLLAPASFEYENYWKTGPDYSRREEYKKLKKQFADTLIKRVEKLLPELSDHIIDLDISTPVTMHRYTLNNQGAAVGWSYLSKRKWKQRIPFIGNLYCAGHWVGPSGVFNVTSSGKSAAEMILRGQREGRDINGIVS